MEEILLYTIRTYVQSNYFIPYRSQNRIAVGSRCVTVYGTRTYMYVRTYVCMYVERNERLLNVCGYIQVHT